VGFSHKRQPEIVPSTAQAEQVRLTVPPTTDNALSVFEQVQIKIEKYVQPLTHKVLRRPRLFTWRNALQIYNPILCCLGSELLGGVTLRE
jgi:hypothetical protein